MLSLTSSWIYEAVTFRGGGGGGGGSIPIFGKIREQCSPSPLLPMIIITMERARVFFPKRGVSKEEERKGGCSPSSSLRPVKAVSALNGASAGEVGVEGAGSQYELCFSLVHVYNLEHDKKG